MQRIPMEVGRVVYATQGRDRGRYFIVLSLESGTQRGEQSGEGSYVRMADGLTRTLEHPKKKKIKHLRAKPIRMDTLTELRNTNRLKDSDLRSFLKENGLGLEQPLCEED